MTDIERAAEAYWDREERKQEQRDQQWEACIEEVSKEYADLSIGSRANEAFDTYILNDENGPAEIWEIMVLASQKNDAEACRRLRALLTVVLDDAIEVEAEQLMRDSE